MIVFKGKLSENGRKLALHDTKILKMLIGIITPIPIAALIIYVGICVNHIYFYFLLICVVMEIFWGLDKLTDEQKDYIMPIKVEIDDEHVIKEKTKDYKTYRVDEVKRVEDYGDFYRIIFYFPHCDRFCICQKDLITQGTIEEFEEMFAGYIVKKQLKK